MREFFVQKLDPEIGSLFLLHSFSECGILILSNICSILFFDWRRSHPDENPAKYVTDGKTYDSLRRAKYDVAARQAVWTAVVTASALATLFRGICHTFSADGRCVSLLKILFTNECIFNCSYCQNNCNSDVRRAAFTPEEVAN